MVTGDVTLLTEPLSCERAFLRLLILWHCDCITTPLLCDMMEEILKWLSCMFGRIVFILTSGSFLSSPTIHPSYPPFPLGWPFILFFVCLSSVLVSSLCVLCSIQDALSLSYFYFLLSLLPSLIWTLLSCPVLSQTANVALFFSGSVFMCQEVLVLGIIRY